MARQQSTIISTNPAGESKTRQDNNGNQIAFQIKQALNTGNVEVIRTTSDTGALSNSSEGSVLVGDPTVFPNNVDNNATAGVPREKMDVEGAVRALDFVDSAGRKLSETIEQLLPSAPLISRISSSVGVEQEATTSESASTRGGSVSLNSGDSILTEDYASNDPYFTGIFGDGGATVNGTINLQVDANSPQYADDAFGKARTGELRLYLNGSQVDSVSLDNGSSQNSTGGSGTTLGSGTGFAVSAPTAVDFEDGTTPTGPDYYRTGEWQVAESSLSGNGLYTVEVVHWDTSLGQEVASSNVAVFYYDPGNDGTHPLSITLQGGDSDGYNYTSISLSSAGSNKTISGVTYYDEVSLETDVDISNLYYFTYRDDAIAFNNVNKCEIDSFTTTASGSYGATLTVDSGITMGGSSSVQKSLGSATSPYTSIEYVIEVRDNIQTNVSSTATSNDKFLVDTVQSQTNADLRNDFEVEDRRVQPGVTTWNNVSVNYDSTNSLLVSPYDDQLQTFNGSVVYPNGDFRNSSNGGDTANVYGPSNANRDYSTATGQREYVGYFTDTTATANFRLYITGNGGNVVPSSNSISGTDDIYFQIRVGTDSGGTGWLDVTLTKDNEDGAYVGGNSKINGTSDTTLELDGGTESLEVTSGTVFTNNWNDRLFYRIVMAEESATELDQVRVDWDI